MLEANHGVNYGTQHLPTVNVIISPLHNTFQNQGFLWAHRGRLNLHDVLWLTSTLHVSVSLWLCKLTTLPSVFPPGRTAGAQVPPHHSHALIICISPAPIIPPHRMSALFRILHGCLRVRLISCVVGRSHLNHWQTLVTQVTQTCGPVLPSRWKTVSLITNHVIMWKPQHPQRINESLLDKIHDSLWADDDFQWEKWVDRFVCGFVYIWKSWVNFEIMLKSLIEYGKCIGNVG